MTLEEIKQKKKEMGLSNVKLAELSGIPLGTIQKVFSGATESPRYETISRLDKFFTSICSAQDIGTSSKVCETTVPYMVSSGKRQGEYTLEDYYKIPDDKRAELIDGVIYDMPAPSMAHQLLSGYFSAKFFNHISEKGGNCLSVTAPLDVRLDCDAKTMVQPDVIILCDRSKVIRRGLYGAPDFVLEILSPSTKKKDMIIKLNKYMNAGVREYWILEPKTCHLTVYDFEHENFPLNYEPGDIVPVAVLGGQCKIDLKEVFDYIAFLPDDEEE